MTDDLTLIERHRPLLIALPQEPALHRPWKRWYESVKVRQGDYHPCKAEFFLSYVVQRAKPRSFWAGIYGDPAPPGPTGLEALKALAATATPDQTLEWEIDLSPIQSQDGVAAWQAYGPILAAGAFEPAIYGRCVRLADGICLQYWFLYMYNDAPNRHEGDWEMINIKLDASEQPVEAAYAGHEGGLRRAWADVERDGDRPLVYIARGSHASFYDHKEGGHRSNVAILPNKGLPFPIEAVMKGVSWLVQTAIFFLRLEDQTPTHPDLPGETPLQRGDWVNAEVIMFPEIETVTPDSEFWWMRLRCPWGSCHTRLFGDTAPDPPWEQGQKWSDPMAWMTKLAFDKK